MKLVESTQNSLRFVAVLARRGALRSRHDCDRLKRAVEPPLDSSNITGENFNGNYPLQQQHPSNPVSSLAGMDWATSSSFLQTLFDTDEPPQRSLISMNNDYSIYNTYKNPNQHIHFPFTNTPSTTQPRDTSSLSHVSPKKSGSEPAVKRARIQTPSPLPTFKVRKEKLGDRVTALQQLVSPFGKTDTASVLHEAVEYIKFLHDQVTVLSRPYLKKGSPRLQNRPGEEAGAKQDLNSRGLCLVPISTTFPETTTTDDISSK